MPKYRNLIFFVVTYDRQMNGKTKLITLPLAHVHEVLMQGYINHSPYDRDEAQNKMLALKEKADKEMTQYNTELKELVRIIDHDRKLREFMSRKDQERAEAHEEMEAMKRKREAEKSSEREGTVMVSVIST